MSHSPIDVDRIKEFSNFFPDIIRRFQLFSDKDGSFSAGLVSRYFKSRQISEMLLNEGITAPKILIISPTMKCNLSCIGCYSRNYCMEDELTLEELDRIITESESLGIFFFIISGGEPLLKEGMIDVLKNHKGSIFWIFTNGTMFNDGLASEIKQNVTGFLFFSLEGFENETDFWRGKGTYSKVIKAMEFARGENIPFGFSVTPTKLNINVLTRDEFIDTMIGRGCTIGIFSHYNHSANVPDVFSCDQRERELLKTWVNEVNETKDFLLIDTRAMEELAGGCCGGGIGLLHINSQGYVTPCPLLNSGAASIREKSLKDILCLDKFSEILEKRHLFGIGKCPGLSAAGR